MFIHLPSIQFDSSAHSSASAEPRDVEINKDKQTHEQVQVALNIHNIDAKKTIVSPEFTNSAVCKKKQKNPSETHK